MDSYCHGAGSRFIVEQHCGHKDENLFRQVMNTVAGYVGKVTMSPFYRMEKGVMAIDFSPCVGRH